VYYVKYSNVISGFPFEDRHLADAGTATQVAFGMWISGTVGLAQFSAPWGGWLACEAFGAGGYGRHSRAVRYGRGLFRP